MRLKTLLPLAMVACLSAATATAATTTYSLFMTGDQEFPTPGDPDGLATGLLSLDDVNNLVSWDFTYSNIASPTAMHIHGPNGSAGSAAGVLVGLSTAGDGVSTLVGSTATSAANISSILANPTNFYVNIHNSSFTAGAVRGQLGTIVPEPVAAVLLLVVLGGFGALRRR